MKGKLQDNATHKEMFQCQSQCQSQCQRAMQESAKMNRKVFLDSMSMSMSFLIVACC